MKLYTIGFTKKTAEEFFETLIKNEVKKVIDIRLKNKSQLAGFAKGKDLKYFLKKIGSIEYIHLPEFAPSDDLMKGYRGKKISWDEYEQKYLALLKERDDLSRYDIKYFADACLLCSESTAQKCHRRLLAEYIRDFKGDIEIIHI